MNTLPSLSAVLALVATSCASAPDPVVHFVGEHSITPGDKVLKIETDINGDSRKEILLCLKSDFDKDKANHEPAPWTLYIAENGATPAYSKSTGTETKPNELSVDDIPQIDHERCFIGPIDEVGGSGIVTIRDLTPREGPTVHVIYAYTITGSHLKRTELARYEDSATPHAIYAKYLADDKRTIITPVETSP